MTSHIIRNARLSDGSHVDVYLSAGIIEKTTPHDPTAVVNEHDTNAQGQLLLPTLAEPHAHLDKAFLAERIPNPSGDLLGAIHAVRERHVFGHTPTLLMVPLCR